MSIGYRPKGESGPLYHPDRDYAYITPTLMCAAISRLEAPVAEETKEWRAAQQITDAEIFAAADALARAQRDFINAADPVTSLEQALNRRDFADLRYPVRLLLFATIGEVFCAAWFEAVREVSKINEDSPAAAGIADFIAAVRSLVGSKTEICASAATVAHVQLRNDVLQSRLSTLYKHVQRLEGELAASRDNTPKPAASSRRSWFRGFFFWK
jgi:hypothetical protein